MTRDEFMKSAEAEIEMIARRFKNSIMNIVLSAWAQGKKAAELDALTEIAKEAFERIAEYENTKRDQESD